MSSRPFWPTVLVFAAAAAMAAPPPAPQPAAADPFADSLVFDNGDALHGGLRSFSLEQGVEWAHKNSATPIRFGQANLDCLELNRPALPAAAAADDMLVQLDNGDTLSGKLVEYTPQETVLETWYAGRLVLPSASVCGLFTAARPDGAPVVDGVGKQEDWICPNGNDNNAKFGAAALAFNNLFVGKKVDFPAQFKLDVTLEAKNKSLDFYLLLFVKDGDPNNWGREGLKINLVMDGAGVTVGLSHETSNGQDWSGGGFYIPSQGGKIALSFGVDTRNRRLVLFKDGEVFGSTPLGAGLFDGGHLVLGSDNNEGILSGLKLSAWDGRRFTPWPVPAADIIGFANGDQTSGRLLAIRGGKASFKTEFAAMEAPLERISHVVLAHPPGQAHRPDKDAVRLYFNALDRMTLRLKTIGAGKAVGTHPVFGECACELGAVRRLQFNGNGLFRLVGGWGRVNTGMNSTLSLALSADGAAAGRIVDNNGNAPEVRLVRWSRTDEAHVVFEEETKDDDGKKTVAKHRYAFKLEENKTLELKALDGGLFNGVFQSQPANAGLSSGGLFQ